MLTDPKLRSQVDSLWDKFWTGGLANPLDAIEQFSYLLFLKQLEDRENADERQAKRRGAPYQSKLPKAMRWSYWSQLNAEEALSHLKKEVFPNIVNLAAEQSSFAQYMRNAECKINKPSLLIEACKLIDQMDISSQNQDVVQRQFEEFIIRHQYNADPIRFLRAVQSVFLDKRKLVAADLYEPPLTNFGSDAVDKWFNKKEVVEIVAFTNLLTI